MCAMNEHLKAGQIRLLSSFYTFPLKVLSDDDLPLLIQVPPIA